MGSAKSTWAIRCRFAGCMFRRIDIALKSDAKRHAKAHTDIGGAAHEVTLTEQKPLPSTPRVGDRIKLKAERIPDYRDACKLAGYEVNYEAVHEVIRTDDFDTGGRKRLFISVPPFAFYSADVVLAWHSDAERRKALGL